MKSAMEEIAEMAMAMLKLEHDAVNPPEEGHHSKGELHAKRCAYIDALIIVAKHAGVSEDEALDMLDMFADEPKEEARAEGALTIATDWLA